MDLLFLFWAVSAGILCGVSLLVLAIVFCVAMTGFLIILEMIPNTKASSVLVLRSESVETNWEEIEKVIKHNTRYYKEKSRNIRKHNVEVIIELKTSHEEEMLKALREFDTLSQISYLTHDGELRI